MLVMHLHITNHCRQCYVQDRHEFYDLEDTGSNITEANNNDSIEFIKSSTKEPEPIDLTDLSFPQFRKQTAPDPSSMNSLRKRVKPISKDAKVAITKANPYYKPKSEMRNATQIIKGRKQLANRREKNGRHQKRG